MASKGPALGVDLGLDEYDGFLDWFVSLRVPWAANGQLWWEPTFLSNELEFYLVALCVGLHAWRHGSRYVWLAAAICCHGITVELASYWLEPIDSFWHAQSTLMFFGKREPLQIFIVYVNYLYICAVAVKRLRVPELCEGPTLALLVIVLDVPYDVMGIKLLWWTWHETDANIRDRNYWVPWTSYLFHMTFACVRTYFEIRSSTSRWLLINKLANRTTKQRTNVQKTTRSPSRSFTTPPGAVSWGSRARTRATRCGACRSRSSGLRATSAARRWPWHARGSSPCL